MRELTSQCVQFVMVNWNPPYLLRPSSIAECKVMPLMLNAVTPVGAVSNTVTSSGSIVPENLRSLRVLEYINLMTWDFLTPPGPLRNT